MTRVKKIIAVDPDIAICSNNAAFVITLATVRLTLSSPQLDSIPLTPCAGNVHPASRYRRAKHGQDGAQATTQHPIQRPRYASQAMKLQPIIILLLTPLKQTPSLTMTTSSFSRMSSPKPQPTSRSRAKQPQPAPNLRARSRVKQQRHRRRIPRNLTARSKSPS